MNDLEPHDLICLNAADGWLGFDNVIEADKELKQITAAMQQHPEVLARRCEMFARAECWPKCEEVAEEILLYREQVDQTGTLVSISLVRELGPVLTALMMAGRNSSGIASELGSMKVTEQIDAMRALGTDPIQKLVTPRMIATAVMLPLLTILADFIGMFGGWFVSRFFLELPSQQYWSTVWRALEWNDITQGLLKPFVFAFIISLVGCYYGLRASGGTQGVGRATTQSMVAASVLILILDFFLGKIFVSQAVS